MLVYIRVCVRVCVCEWVGDCTIVTWLQAAVSVQRIWRGTLVRRSICQANAAAVVVQQYWRGHIQHTKFRRLLEATVSMQARVRQWQAVRGFATARAAIIKIQVPNLSCIQYALRVQAYHQHTKGFLLSSASFFGKYTGHGCLRCGPTC